MRRLIIASEPVHAEGMRRFAATFAGVGLAPTALGSGYGLAEATVAVSMSAPNTGFRTETHAAAEVVTGGRVLPGYEVRIDAAPGARAGTIKLRGDSVAAKAYVGGKKLDALDEEGFCDTHDLGFLVDDEIVILGRQDEVFIVHGENRFPTTSSSSFAGNPSSTGPKSHVSGSTNASWLCWKAHWTASSTRPKPTD